MKNILLILALAAAMLSCKGEDNGPVDVATGYWQSLDRVDFENAAKYCSGEALTDMKHYAQIASEASPSLMAATKALKTIYKIEEQDIGKTKASIRYRVTTIGPHVDAEPYEFFETLYLEKVTGKWLIVKREADQ